MARLLPVKLPASVWGIVLLFIALLIKLFKPHTIEKTADFLLSNMGLFFLPPAIAIIEQFDLLHPVVFQFFIVAILATVLTFLATYTVVYLVRLLFRGRHSS
jgi:putative effector of murein hydrolase LrgA (UPF0299 family)